MIEQIAFCLSRGLVTATDLVELRSFVFEDSFEQADGGMERRASAWGRFPVPHAIIELLTQQLPGQRAFGSLKH